MYRYNLTLWLSDESLRKEIKLTDKEYRDAIEIDAKEHYNAISRRSKNPKAITECKVVNNSGASEIRITLESEAVLNTPNRALKVFSSYLANGALSDLVRYNSLFRGSAEEVEINSHEEEISDEALLNMLIRCVLKKSKEDRDLLESVKAVVKSQ
ncbi:hypothetical protein R70723_07435 [Paenibacillus sp. FSL R7-0273]|uniref:hypothetical protein n=1 Tax=Paenibacillus sp. FSL R7-0273 TaxID=1536772 RepID=UPI0004F92EEB|nr:hypothetical protein [Paenibacillus sp. FSL R7-0273]AIQ45738.1 hypothetical protein R70723_07435 [Paenibacillus sp. FSL R7-0273]OMF95260.1 hypothetical protein BK144_06945 [Paenibacillus sp. FSL R7-0273]